MTQEQANKILNAFTDIAACDGNGESVSIIMHELREAVEKQVPTKMRKERGKRYCPRCNELVLDAGECEECIVYALEYCPDCGQRLSHEAD